MNTVKFGITKDSKEVNCYTLKNKDLVLKVLDYGATIQSLFVKNKKGEFVDVVLGYDSIGDYEKNDCYFGATIGRYGNRIALGKFTLNGKVHILNTNNGKNHLHGGNVGFDKHVWEVTEMTDESITFYKFSPDGEEGYSGNLKVYVTFKLTDENELNIEYKACSDMDTPLSLTNHTYFNLNGGGSAIEQELQINAEQYLENDKDVLPTGKMLDVKNSPFDFRKSKAIKQNIFDFDVQLENCKGYDHNFCVGKEGELKHIATLRGNEISMETYTTEPGVQLYSGNFIEKHMGKNGTYYEKHSGICLETQKYPNSPNEPNFPSCILEKETWYKTQTIYKFNI